MVERHDRTATHRLHARSRQVRLRAIKAQLSASSTLCKLMEAAVDHGRTDELHNLIGKLRETLASVDRHLDEPHHVPKESLADVRDQLARLERRVAAIEKRLKS